MVAQERLLSGLGKYWISNPCGQSRDFKMAELNFAAIPLRQVKRVQFGILGPEEIVRKFSSHNTLFPFFTLIILYLTEKHVCHST